MISESRKWISAEGECPRGAFPVHWYDKPESHQPPDAHRPSPNDSMFSGDQIATLFTELGITHVVTIPDSTLGQWDRALDDSASISVVRVCREGEAWEVAAGLYLGGATPIVMIQCTGLFESGDALRNVLHDWKLPIFSLIGYRSYLSQDTIPGDSCLIFTEPILDAWRIDYRLITESGQFAAIREHYVTCRDAAKPGTVLIAEGKA